MLEAGVRDVDFLKGFVENVENGRMGSGDGGNAATNASNEKVFVYTETTGLGGHAWISVGTGQSMIVYSYGRYDRTTASSRPASLKNGPGVLLRLVGWAAINYNNEKFFETGSVVFEIKGIDANKIKEYFDNKFNSSTKKPTRGKYKDRDDARIIDRYVLMGNNCTNNTVKALKLAGLKDFEYSTDTYEVIWPLTLRANLYKKSYKEPNIVSVADEFPKGWRGYPTPSSN